MSDFLHESRAQDGTISLIECLLWYSLTAASLGPLRDLGPFLVRIYYAGAVLWVSCAVWSLCVLYPFSMGVVPVLVPVLSVIN